MKHCTKLLLAAVLALTLAACGAPAAQSPSAAPAETARPVESVAPAAPDASAPEESAPPTDPQPAQSGPSEDLESAQSEEPDGAQSDELLPEDGTYTTKEDVALYLHQYGHLPGNFITKKEAQALGWPGGSLEPYAPGMCIGGSRFGNYEGLLPEAEGRVYTECDIDTLGADSRGAKRIVFSNDGLIYYTEDHYASFELLYGDESDG